MRIVVVGDIHAQERKLWTMLDEAGLSTLPTGREIGKRNPGRKPTHALTEGGTHLVLLGDVVHPKSRERYAELIGAERFDEFDPRQLAAAQRAQEEFLDRLKAFFDACASGAVTILLGNHDANAIDASQGPLRTDDVAHLEWKQGYGDPLPPHLASWMATWPREHVVHSLHFAHVGPKPEHNVYDTSFYVDNRRKWIYEDVDYLEGTPYAFGFYGHTPVRGGLNLASRGRALLLDTNARGDEYVWCDLDVDEDTSQVRCRLRGLYLDTSISMLPTAVSAST